MTDAPISLDREFGHLYTETLVDRLSSTRDYRSTMSRTKMNAIRIAE